MDFKSSMNTLILLERVLEMAEDVASQLAIIAILLEYQPIATKEVDGIEKQLTRRKCHRHRYRHRQQEKPAANLYV